MDILSLEEIKSFSLDILVFFDKYCSDNNLRYYLAFGTLLGAVRHRGFIPWDDDIDVYVPRPDYDRVIEQFKDPNGRYAAVSCFNDASYLNPFAKIVDRRIKSITESGEIGANGLGIDLFPLDGLPSDMDETERLFRRMNRRWYNVEDRLASYHRMIPTGLVNRLKRLLGDIAFNSGFLTKGIQKLSVSPFSSVYDESLKVANLMGEYDRKIKPLDRSWFEEDRMEFEGHLFVVPKGYHMILREVYGDYMQLPPEEERKSTHTESFILLDDNCLS